MTTATRPPRSNKAIFRSFFSASFFFVQQSNNINYYTKVDGIFVPPTPRANIDSYGSFFVVVVGAALSTGEILHTGHAIGLPPIRCNQPQSTLSRDLPCGLGGGRGSEGEDVPCRGRGRGNIVHPQWREQNTRLTIFFPAVSAPLSLL